jgi:hypothetical protein
MERLFQITAVILIGIAAYFLWLGNKDAVFVSAVLGAVAFFLSIRFQVKERLEQRDDSAEEIQSREDFEKDSTENDKSEINESEVK